MRTCVRTWGAVISAVVVLLPGTVAAQMASSVRRFLAQDVQFTPAEIAAVDIGTAAAKLVPSPNDREVTVFGAVRVPVPRAFFLQRNLDFQGSPRAESRSAFGMFSDPARLEDLTGLEFGRDEVSDLRACRPGSCDMKLPATVMTELQAQIDLSAPDAVERVTTYARRKLVDLVDTYRRRGDAAMVVYADRGSVSGSEAFEQLIAETSYLYRYVPSLHQHLLDYPRSALPGASEAIYWAVDELPRMKRLIHVAHQVVYSPPELAPATVVATKTIYANHYFEAGLEILTALDGERGTDANEISVLLLRRYRFDQLPGGVLNIRQRVSDGLRDQTRADLQTLAKEYQEAWSAASRR